MAALAYAPRVSPNGNVRKNRRARVGELGALTTLRLVAIPTSGKRGVSTQPVAFRPEVVEPLPAVLPEDEVTYAPIMPLRTPHSSREFDRRVAEHQASVRRVRAAKLRRRRAHVLGVTLASFGLFAAIWFGSSAMASQSQTRLQVLPGSVKTAHGYLYRVQPGDTVWSIATQLNPTGDPRSLAGQLEAEIGGTDLQAGTQVLLP